MTLIIALAGDVARFDRPGSLISAWVSVRGRPHWSASLRKISRCFGS
jgi:hypothetical protein